MQVSPIEPHQRFSKNNYSFNGRLRIYNYHKNRWFTKYTTEEADKVLFDIFNNTIREASYNEKLNSTPFISRFKGKVMLSELLEYINKFSRNSQGINLPKPTEKDSCINTLKYVILRKKIGSNNKYAISVDGVFKLIHDRINVEEA